MKLIAKFFDWVFDPGYTRSQAWAEDYLARASDASDLERRIRELDRRTQFGPFGLNA